MKSVINISIIIIYVFFILEYIIYLIIMCGWNFFFFNFKRKVKDVGIEYEWNMLSRFCKCCFNLCKIKFFFIGLSLIGLGLYGDKDGVLNFFKKW